MSKKKTKITHTLTAEDLGPQRKVRMVKVEVPYHLRQEIQNLISKDTNDFIMKRGLYQAWD